jgi:hypothetical protein
MDACARPSNRRVAALELLCVPGRLDTSWSALSKYIARPNVPKIEALSYSNRCLRRSVKKAHQPMTIPMNRSKVAQQITPKADVVKHDQTAPCHKLASNLLKDFRGHDGTMTGSRHIGAARPEFVWLVSMTS